MGSVDVESSTGNGSNNHDGEIEVDEVKHYTYSSTLSSIRSRSSLCIMGAGFCGYAAFGGFFFNLVLYLTGTYHRSIVVASNDITNLLGTMFFTSLVGAFLGDAYWGKMKTVLVFLIIFFVQRLANMEQFSSDQEKRATIEFGKVWDTLNHTMDASASVGIVLSSVAVTWQQLSYPVNYPPASNVKAFLFTSLYITALGNGSYEPVLAALGGDQFTQPREKAIFLNWFFVACSLGQLFALTVVTYFENEGNWAVGFWVSSAAVLLAGAISLAGLPATRQLQSGAGNPFLRIAQVFVVATRRSSLKVDSHQPRPPLYEISGSKSAIRGCRKILHTNRLRCFDRAAMLTKHKGDQMPSTTPNPWHVCTITQVEEVKCIVAILPIIVTGALFNTILAQIQTFFIEQGNAMDKALGPSFNMPPGSMQVFTIFAAIFFAPLYDYILVPLLRKKTGCPMGLTTLQRIGWGYAVSVVVMIVAALVEIRRLNAFPQPLSIFWLVPQYSIAGVSIALTIVGQMDFFYTEISDGMRSLGISIPLVCRGLGNYASTLLVTVVTNVTTSGGKLGWIPRNLNDGHVDRFYWLLAIFMVVTLVLHLISAHVYIYLELGKDEDDVIDNPQRC